MKGRRHERRLHRRSIGLVTALATAVACGGGQTRLNLFSTSWEDDGGASIARVWQRVGSKPIPPSADVVIGIAGHADKMVGLPLGGGSKWTFAHPIETRPIVAGGVVVGSGGGEAFALDATTGQVIWRRSTGQIALLGAGDDGTVTVASFRAANSSGSVLLAIAHDGQIVRQIETGVPLGAPAVVDRLAFVPWDGQYISVVDLLNGDEMARVTLRDETSRAWTEEGSLWFGGVAFTRFDEHIRDASKGKASRATIKVPVLPGEPKLMRSANSPVMALADAQDKVKLYARPKATGDGVAIEDGRWYGTYFRLAMGFDASAGRLGWVHLNGSDFVGASAASGGIVLCDEQGKVTELDGKSGAVLSEQDLGEPVKACVVNVDARAATGSPTGAQTFEGQLAEAVLADDPQLVGIQKVLLRELAGTTDEAATKALVDLASDPRTSPELMPAARTALAARRTGARFMEAALARHYDFLKDVLRAPPVGPIAQALGAMKDRSAAPLLASHLFDPADTDDDVMRAAEALAVVAGPDELPAMRQFFGMYRATAADDNVAAAVVSVGRALLALDGAQGRTRIDTAAKDPMTVEYARDGLGELLAAPSQEPGDAGKKK
jgi:outer membrane protein assembly factor BamB